MTTPADVLGDVTNPHRFDSGRRTGDSPVDIYRGTEGIVLPLQVSQEIWAEAVRNSIVMQLCRRIPIPASGLTIPIITGDPEAEWIDETEEKPVSRSTFGSKTLRPYTAAVIEPFSKQFARDLPALYAECRTRLPYALSKKFDRAALGIEDSPGTGFDSLADSPEIAIEGNVYDSFLEALLQVGSAADGADVTRWALSLQAEVAALGALDNNGKPLFTLSPATDGSIGSLLGRPVFKSPNVYDPDSEMVGVGGDWNTAVWGYVQQITVDLSDQATLTDSDGKTINLWQRNMIALRAEFEVGFAIRDPQRFARFTWSGEHQRGGRRPPKKTAEPGG